MILGSNYPFFSTSPKDGVVYNYHLQRALCQEQLGKMVAAGQSALRIPLFCWAAEESYIPDGFTLGLYGNSLDDQRMTNLQNLVADAKAAGFTYIEIGPGGAGNTLSPYNWSSVDQKWFRMGNFIALLRSSFPGCHFDLAGEWIDANNPVVLDYCRVLWTWYTTAFWFAQRCEDATISFTPESRNIALVPSVFAGTNKGGPVNWPKRLQVHPYGATDEWGSTYDVVMGAMTEIEQLNPPPDTEIVFGEEFPFKEYVSNQEIERALADEVTASIKNHLTDLNVTMRIQWPLMPDGTIPAPV